ncbi:Angiotensin-converting enzyme 2 [Bertholletia excelsa]
MSSIEARKHIWECLKLVQDLIEQCLSLYMSRKEVIATLLDQNIKREYIEPVLKSLEKENPEFFKAYYIRLIVKDQINQFNKLLDRQVEFSHRVDPAGVASMPMSNVSHPAPYIPTYSRSPFLASDANCFLDPRGRGEQQGDGTL